MPGATERAFVASPLAAAGGRVIVAPFQFYTDGAESLRFEAWNSVTGVVVALQGRWFNKKGDLQTFERSLVPTADRARTRTDIALEPGYLVTLAAFASSGAPRIGQTYVKVSLIRGLTGATMLVGQLLGGYVTAEQGLGWPGSPIIDSISGGGVIRAILGTAPAAGAELNENVPTGARWQLLSARAALTTNATVADRRAVLQPTAGGLAAWQSVMYTVVPASVTAIHDWAPGLTLDNNPVGTRLVAGLSPDTLMLSGDLIATLTFNLQAGDQWSAPTLVVREWLEVDA